MQTNVIQMIRPVPEVGARPFLLKFHTEGVSCELAFASAEARQERAAELVANGTAVVFKQAV
jgi:hypothetical protein